MWKRIHTQASFLDMPNPAVTQTLPTSGIISSNDSSLVGQQNRVYTVLVFTNAGVPVTGVDLGAYDIFMWQQCTEQGASSVYCTSAISVGVPGYESVPWYDVDALISRMEQRNIYTGISVCNIVAPAAATGFYVLARSVS